MEVSLSRLAAVALVAILPAACSGGGSSVPSVPATQNVTPQSVAQTVTTQSVKASTGNGAPNAPEYVLNIIGVPKTKTASMTNTDGHTIFVNLNGTSDIWLQKSTGTFQVLDANGTDTTSSPSCTSQPGYDTCGGALFELPAPGNYSIWERALGQPNNSATLTTCAYDYTTTTPTLVCSTQQNLVTRFKGKSTFENVTSDLTQITIDPALATSLGLSCNFVTKTTINIFDPCLQNYFWNYDNNGLKHLQLRVYGPV